jgi:hypothetical protein
VLRRVVGGISDEGLWVDDGPGLAFRPEDVACVQVGRQHELCRCDWNVAISISYPNYAALDQLAAKGATIVNKHFGSREAALASGKKQDEVREVIASHLAREVMSK